MMTLAAAGIAFLSFGTSTDPTIYPVAFDDPVLQNEETFVSEAAQTAIRDGSDIILRCFEMPEGSSEHDRVCLTTGEWQAVFDEIAHQESVARRTHAIGLSQWRAGAMARNLTP